MTCRASPNPVDTFVWRIIRESSTKRIAMEAGEIQYGDVFTVEDIAALRDDDRFMVNDVAELIDLLNQTEQPGWPNRRCQCPQGA